MSLLAENPWLLPVLFAEAAALLVILVLSILAAASFPPPTQLALVLAIIGVIALGGYLALGETRSELMAIAGASVGALAGALTTVHGRKAPPGGEGSPPAGPPEGRPGGE